MDNQYFQEKYVYFLRKFLEIIQNELKRDEDVFALLNAAVVFACDGIASCPEPKMKSKMKELIQESVNEEKMSPRSNRRENRRTSKES